MLKCELNKASQLKRIIQTRVVYGSVMIVVLFGAVGQRAIFAASEVAQLSATMSATPSAQVPEPVQPLNLTISPTTINLLTQPGKPTSTTIKIRNNGGETENMKIRFGKFTADATGDRAKLLDATPEDKTLSWLSVDQQEFSVGANEWKSVNLTFSPPNDAAFSYYYTVLLERQRPAASKGSESVIEGVPAILALTTVETPNAKRELTVESISVEKSVIEFLPQKISVVVKNTGNVHVIPTGNIFVDGEGKQDVAVLPFNAAGQAVLPNTSRTFVTEWNDGFPRWLATDPTSEGNKGVHFGGAAWDFGQADRFRIGKYTAHLLLVYDNGQRDVPLESFLSFWVIPWKLLIVGCLLAVFVGVGVKSTLMQLWQNMKRLFHR